MEDILNKGMDFNSDLYTIRTISNRDLPQIKELMEGSKDRKDTAFIDIYELMKYSLGSNQLLHMFVVEVDEEIVAVINYFDYLSALYGKSAHVQCIFIKESYKGIGIGRILLGYLIKNLLTNRYNRLTIDIDKENELSVKRMKFFNAKPLVDVKNVEMSNDSLSKFVNSI